MFTSWYSSISISHRQLPVFFCASLPTVPTRLVVLHALGGLRCSVGSRLLCRYLALGLQKLRRRNLRGDVGEIVARYQICRNSLQEVARGKVKVKKRTAVSLYDQWVLAWYAANCSRASLPGDCASVTTVSVFGSTCGPAWPTVVFLTRQPSPSMEYSTYVIGHRGRPLLHRRKYESATSP